MRALLLVTLLGGLAVAQTVTPIQFADGVRVNDAVYTDINGDGLTDLAVPIREPGRAINVYLQRKQGVLFTSEPDYRLAPVYKDAVVFAVADVHPDRGSEIVLVTAKGIFAWRPIGPEKERAVKLTDCDLLVSVGTSAVVYPAAQMPLVAKQAGATLVEINPEPTQLSGYYDHTMRGTATAMLAELCAGLES